MATSKKDEPIKVEVVPTVVSEEPGKDEKKVLQAQADQMYGKAEFHAPGKPTRLDHRTGNGIPSFGAPVAQGPNISKEEAEFAANAGGAEPEKTPASTEVK